MTPAAPQLRPYQVDMLDAIERSRAAGLTRVLCHASTGLGKTLTFAALLRHQGIADWLASLPPAVGCQMLVVAHREELLDQACEKIRAQNPGLMVSIEQGDRYSNGYSDVVIASVQTLAALKFRRLERFLQRHHPRIVVIDEAHHAAAKTYRSILAFLGFLPLAVSTEDGDIEAATHDDVIEMQKALRGWDAVAPKDRLLIGVTATPNRTDAIGLGCVFQAISYSYALRAAITDGWLAPIKPWVIETAEDLDGVKTTAGDFNQKQLAEAVNKSRRNRIAVDAWKVYASDRSTLAFTVDVQHAVDLAAVFRADGITAVPLSGETPKDERRSILADYTAGKIQVITNCMVLTEGTDLPRTGCILHAKPTKSPTLYEQMTGRGLRMFPGKENCIVLDVVDVSRRHSLQTAPVLYGLPPGINTQGEELGELADKIDRLRERMPSMDVEAALQQRRMSVAELLDRAATFDVWTVQPLGEAAAGCAFDWIRAGEVYRLQYPWTIGDEEGSETLTVSPDMLGHWDLACTFTPKPASGPPYLNARRHAGQHVEPVKTRQRTLGAQIATANAALLLAESFIVQSRGTVTRIVDNQANWKKRPASDKQIALLRRLRVPHNAATLTMGAAGRLINIAKARGWRR